MSVLLRLLALSGGRPLSLRAGGTGLTMPEILRGGLKEEATSRKQLTGRVYQVSKAFKVSIFLIFGLSYAGQTLLIMCYFMIARKWALRRKCVACKIVSILLHATARKG